VWAMIDNIMPLTFKMRNDPTLKVQACVVAANMDFHGAILSKKREDPHHIWRRSLGSFY